MKKSAIKTVSSGKSVKTDKTGTAADSTDSADIRQKRIYNARRLTAAVLLSAAVSATVLIMKLKHCGPVMPVPEYRTAGAAAEQTESQVSEIYEYTDFACPACAAANVQLQNMMNTYGSRIKLHFKHFPLSMHKWSGIAALYADCAGEQGRFFQYGEMLFRNQEEWADKDSEPEEFRIYADRLGLDRKQMESCVRKTENQTRIKLEKAEGQAKGITATPSFFINGKFHLGAGALAGESMRIEQIIQAEKARGARK